MARITPGNRLYFYQLLEQAQLEREQLFHILS